ncbi:MAG: VWA domain-containing protein [bacterium]|nr:VWA domain-containing protein [bacterium]
MALMLLSLISCKSTPPPPIKLKQPAKPKVPGIPKPAAKKKRPLCPPAKAAKKSRHIAPIAVPEEIEEAEVEGFDCGVIGGVEGGVVGGVLGSSGSVTRYNYSLTPPSAAPKKSTGSNIRYSHPSQSNTEEYQRIYENNFLNSMERPLSTFSIDVDTGSYSNVRRFITNRSLPPKEAVRIEEMINYFSYDYPRPSGKHPFSITTEVSICPWNKANTMLHIGIRGKSVPLKKCPPSNLVFLIDVSGSMGNRDKLPLLKDSFKLLVKQLQEKDRVAIVVYAGAAGLVLPSTSGYRRDIILAAIDRLSSGGSTAGGAGIQLAYHVAEKNMIPNGNNRIILATDGDFNVGVSNTGALVRIIEEKRKKGIFLTTLGFGTGNYKDHRMEQLANKGNGNYYYIDNILEGKKVFVQDMRGTLFTIAKDVKIQVEFNPAKVESYRLVGYENRKMKKEDFDNDKKDAGELGAGHTVTALYEIVPAGKNKTKTKTKTEQNGLRFQETSLKSGATKTGEIAWVKLRYKKPTANKSRLLSRSVKVKKKHLKNPSINSRFSAAVAIFGMLLRDSRYAGDASYQKVITLAKSALGKDPYGYRSQFLQLVSTVQTREELKALNTKTGIDK